jgi:cold-inducible RNA-binding protein
MQNNKLFVRNLSFTCADAELRELFTQFGEVTSVKIATDRDTGKPRGFGFVEMGTQQQAEAAIRALEGTEFGGRTLYVSMSEQREKRSSSYGNRW